MQTIGRHLGYRPRLDPPEDCFYCGIPWPRSKLKTDGDGNFYCPDEGNIRGVGELAREDAEVIRDHRPVARRVR